MPYAVPDALRDRGSDGHAYPDGAVKRALAGFLVLLALGGALHASTVNRSGLVIPTDPALAFTALGGGVGGSLELVHDLAVSGGREPAWLSSWWARLGEDALAGFMVGTAAQTLTGSVQNPARDRDYGVFAAFGAAGAFTISFGAGGGK